MRALEFKNVNRDHVKATQRKRYAADIKRRRAKAVRETKLYKQRYPGKNCAQENLRRARKLTQICTCCTVRQIEEFYTFARALGCEVDHTLALAVGGLHCLKNLQALTPIEHRQKTIDWDIPLIRHAKKYSTIESNAQHFPAPIQNSKPPQFVGSGNPLPLASPTQLY